MSSIIKITRRDFILTTGVGAGALMLGCSSTAPRPVADAGDSGTKPGTEEALGMQGFTAADQRVVAGSRFSVVRDAIFANPYQEGWGAKGNAPLERFPVTFLPLIKGMLPGGASWQFLSAARRVLASDSDLRWGPDGKGYRRLLHANAICMTGLLEITEDTPYTGYFRKGSRGLIIARYSTCCTETRRGNMRSLSMIGRTVFSGCARADEPTTASTRSNSGAESRISSADFIVR